MFIHRNILGVTDLFMQNLHRMNVSRATRLFFLKKKISLN